MKIPALIIMLISIGMFSIAQKSAVKHHVVFEITSNDAIAWKGLMNNKNELLNDIKDNEEKINHHGKRAGAIVKGMLQHSQSCSGSKESTNINKLAGEYLRLAYHGLRAKDNSFNAIMNTDFDESINKINIIPQDIGRVFLNLYTNAFYAVNDKKNWPRFELKL